MTCTEDAVVFDCAGESLVGIVSRPERPSDTAVVIVVGGPQYRAGSHRQFVLLARRLADAGHAVLRFDYRGMGDSSGDQRDFQDVGLDIAAAIDALHRCVPGIERIVLWGLCDAASAALLYCDSTRDPRVAGLCLLNPWVRSAESLARTHVKHYYTQRLMQGAFWRKLLRGGVAKDAWAGFVRSLRVAAAGSREHGTTRSYQQRMLAGLAGSSATVLLLLSGDDYTAKEFADHAAADPGWTEALRGRRVERHDVADADHTFSDIRHRTEVEDLSLRWLGQTLAPRAQASRPTPIPTFDTTT